MRAVYLISAFGVCLLAAVDAMTDIEFFQKMSEVPEAYQTEEHAYPILQWGMAAVESGKLTMTATADAAVSPVREAPVKQSSSGWFSTSPTVTKLELKPYLGKWQQVYSSLSTYALGTGPNVRCAQAEYGLGEGNLNITVFNQGIKKRGYSSIKGYAYVPNEEEIGKFALRFENPNIPTGNYWIMKLGPKVDGKYQYSIVGTKYNFALYVLARDEATFFEKYNKEATEWLSKNNFNNWWNKPRRTPWEGCQDDLPFDPPQPQHR